MKNQVTKPRPERGRDTLFVVLPIISILTPVVLIAVFIAWFWSGWSMDGYAATGTDRFMPALWFFVLALCGIAFKFWYLSVPFCIVAGLALWRLFTSKHHVRHHSNTIA